MALEDESHHAIAKDQQITVRCPLARPLHPKPIFPSASEGLPKTIKANGYSKMEKSFGHVSTKSKALEEQRGFDFMHNIVTGGNKYMKRNRAKEMLASERHSFTDKVCLYMSNEYIAVETESSVSKKVFGWCPGISNLPTQIR